MNFFREMVGDIAEGFIFVALPYFCIRLFIDMMWLR